MANLNTEPQKTKLCDVKVGETIRFDGTPILYTKIKPPKNAQQMEDGSIQNLEYISETEKRLAFSHPDSERLVEVVSTKARKSSKSKGK